MFGKCLIGETYIFHFAGIFRRHTYLHFPNRQNILERELKQQQFRINAFSLLQILSTSPLAAKATFVLTSHIRPIGYFTVLNAGQGKKVISMLQEIKSHNSNVALKLNTNENVPS
jgi:hypothetical protein